MQYTIQFDGGTSCNIPRLGFGNGYGSYRINDEPIRRCNFNRPMSANAAELSTLLYAVLAIEARSDAKTSDIELHIVGDSQIALNWALKAFEGIGKVGKKTTYEFQEAIFQLKNRLRNFKSVTAEWQPRLKSVATFGH